jgi:NAD+ synthase (glutamine-hydrolysing)
VKNIRVAAAVLNQTPLAWRENQRNIIAAIDAAKEQGASIVCLPELCITGYGCEDAFLSPGLHREALATLKQLLPHTAGLLVTVGLPIAYRGIVFNAVALVADGQILGFVPKQNLAGDGIHYEPRWFKPWPVGKRAILEIDGQAYPLGDLIFRFDDILLGLEICEDAWVAERPGTRQSRLGVDIVLNPSASHFAFDKQEIRRRFVLEGSRAFHATYVYANLLGNEAGRAIYDGGALIASAGRLLAEGQRFSFQDFGITTATVDLDLTRLNRAQNQAFHLDFDATRENVIVSDFRFPSVPPETESRDRPRWERSDDLKMEEFTRAVTLALFDYLRKSRSRGFVVSLSGGADSAAVATLCAYMVKFALGDFGVQGFARKLKYLDDFREFASPADIIDRILTCIYQATRNSSDTTYQAAKTLAETVGARFSRMEIDDLVDGYVALGNQVMGRELTWERDDISLQNIQARTRSPSVWLVANVTGSLLLARRVKRQTMGLEPGEITGLVEHREAMLHGIKEGVIGIDADDRVTLINDEAVRLLGLPAQSVGQILTVLRLEAPVLDVLTGRVTGDDQVVLQDDRVLVLNRMPVRVRGREVGAVTTLRDRTEMTALRRELDVSRHATDTLRAQAHDFTNRLHTIAGLVELGEYEEVVHYINRANELQEDLARDVATAIAEPALAALLIAKSSLAAEQGVQLRISPDSSLAVVDDALASDLVTVVGNLVDNALDALDPDGWVEVSVRTTDDVVVITVRDSGAGIAPGLAEDVFRQGFTTKGRSGHRGLGLALIRMICARRGGGIDVEGSTFSAWIPYPSAPAKATRRTAAQA